MVHSNVCVREKEREFEIGERILRLNEKFVIKLCLGVLR
jgi:hypothetical protein